MFTAFLVSLAAMMEAVSMITPWPIWPALFIIFYGAMNACIKYDTADGLKAGLDDALLKQSRAAILFYLKEGVKLPDDDGDGEEE